MSMVAKAWTSGVKSDSSLGNKSGLRWKLFGEDWSPAQHIMGVSSEEYLEAVDKSDKGYALDRRCFPEALTIWNRKCFARVGDYFYANGFVAVKGRLAETLNRFDLGEGGLIPLPIYQEDLTTPEPGEFFLVNFGARKDSLVAEKSASLRQHYVERTTGKQIWTIGSGVKDGDIALTPAAQDGADLWNEERIRSRLFMSDALVTAIRKADVTIDFRLAQCRIVEAN
jgi:hypothetical protein